MAKRKEREENRAMYREEWCQERAQWYGEDDDQYVSLSESGIHVHKAFLTINADVGTEAEGNIVRRIVVPELNRRLRLLNVQVVAVCPDPTHKDDHGRLLASTPFFVSFADKYAPPSKRDPSWALREKAFLLRPCRPTRACVYFRTDTMRAAERRIHPHWEACKNHDHAVVSEYTVGADKESALRELTERIIVDLERAFRAEFSSRDTQSGDAAEDISAEEKSFRDERHYHEALLASASLLSLSSAKFQDQTPRFRRKCYHALNDHIQNDKEQDAAKRQSRRLNGCHRASKRRNFEGGNGILVVLSERSNDGMASFLATFADLNRKAMHRSVIFHSVGASVDSRNSFASIVRLGLELRDMFPDYMEGYEFELPHESILDQRTLQLWWNRVLECASEAAMESHSRPILIIDSVEDLGEDFWSLAKWNRFPDMVPPGISLVVSASGSAEKTQFMRNLLGRKGKERTVRLAEEPSSAYAMLAKSLLKSYRCEESVVSRVVDDIRGASKLRFGQVDAVCSQALLGSVVNVRKLQSN